jgi:hypothetical protein
VRTFRDSVRDPQIGVLRFRDIDGSVFFAGPTDRSVRVVPHLEAADKGTGIVAGATSSRQLLHMNNVSSTYHDVFGLYCSDRAFDYVFHVPAPALLADAVEALGANVIFVMQQRRWAAVSLMPAKNSLLIEISFPVNLCRKLLEKWLQHSGFLATKVASLVLKMRNSL